MDPETSERVLDRLARSAPADDASDSDDDQPGPDFDDDDGVDRTSSADWQKLRQGSIARKKWWRRPSPHWSVELANLPPLPLLAKRALVLNAWVVLAPQTVELTLFST